jgi:protein-tyrosine phosphatase
LFVCTGNVCRSAMAEALVRRRALLSGANVSVSSAGFTAAGLDPPVAAIEVMERRGLDLSCHRSEIVTPGMLAAADVVLGMTQAHVWEAAVLAPDIAPRTFVLGELVRLNQAVGGRRAAETLVAWLDRLHAERRNRAASALTTDAVIDPYGRRRKVYERVAQRLDALVLELADCAFDPLPPLHDARWREGRVISRP